MKDKLLEILLGGVDVIGAVLMYVFFLCSYAAVFSASIEPQTAQVLNSSLTAGELARMAWPFATIAIFGGILRLVYLIPDVVGWFKRLWTVEGA